MPSLHHAPTAVRTAAFALAVLFSLRAPRGAGASTTCDALLERDLYLPPEAEVAGLLAGCPEAPCAALARGAALLAAGEAVAALPEIEMAHSLAPESPWANVYLSMALLQTGDRPGGLLAAERAIEQRPSSPATYAQLGMAHLVAGDTEQAISQFRMAIALAPGRARGHLDLGRAALGAGQPELAEVELQRAIELDSRCHEARFLLAKAQMNAGDVRCLSGRRAQRAGGPTRRACGRSKARGNAGESRCQRPGGVAAVSR